MRDMCDGTVFISLLIDRENFAGDDVCIVVGSFSFEAFVAVMAAAI